MALNRCKNGHLYSEKKNGKICPFCNLSAEQDNTLTEDALGQDAYLDDLEAENPVVGWLVCTKGAAKGKDYRIMPEKNFLGRSPDMDIRVLGDNEIDLRNHAVILYDPEKNHTLVLPGESRRLVHKLDDTDSWELVNESKSLQNGDRLKIGNSEFMFVALCGDNEGFKFDWRDLDET